MPSKATEKKVMKGPKTSATKFSKVAGQKAQEGIPKLLQKSQVKPTGASSQGQHSPSFLTRVVARGKFQKVSDTLVLQAGETLDLRCKGKAAKWKYPPYLDDDDVERRLR